MLEITVNETTTIQTTQEVAITTAHVNLLGLDFDNTAAYMKITYLGSDGENLASRYFKVFGPTYGSIIMAQATGTLAETVLGLTSQFATNLLANPDLINGNDITELNVHEFIRGMLNLEAR